MMKCIVVDDEKIILDELCSMIAQTGTQILGSFQDPSAVLESVQDLAPDAAFLDIEMPGLNGIELAKKIAAHHPDIQIVFVTAYEEYALKAFEVCAVHYLLKPLTQDKINEAVERIKRVRQINKNIGNVEKPVTEDKAIASDRICVKDRDNVIIIKKSDIIYLRSEEGKTVIVTKKGSYKSRAGLHFWETSLEGRDFIRCHRSYVVNAVYITKMIHVLGEYKELVLDYCNINIPISRQKVGALKDWAGIV